MADTNVTTSTDFADSDPIDLDRLAASLDYLRAHFCQGARNESDVCERVASGRDPHRDDLNQPLAALNLT